jgi:hypothetical protein
VTAFAHARGDFANSCAALQQKGVPLRPNNLSQFFAITDHQSERELIYRPPGFNLDPLILQTAFGDFPLALPWMKSARADADIDKAADLDAGIGTIDPIEAGAIFGACLHMFRGDWFPRDGTRRM